MLRWRQWLTFRLNVNIRLNSSIYLSHSLVFSGQVQGVLLHFPINWHWENIQCNLALIQGARLSKPLISLHQMHLNTFILFTICKFGLQVWPFSKVRRIKRIRENNNKLKRHHLNNKLIILSVKTHIIQLISKWKQLLYNFMQFNHVTEYFSLIKCFKQQLEFECNLFNVYHVCPFCSL